MKEEDAWKSAVNALKRYYLQGNSQCPNIDKITDQWIIGALEAIRNTSPKKSTASLVMGN